MIMIMIMIMIIIIIIIIMMMMIIIIIINIYQIQGVTNEPTGNSEKIRAPEGLFVTTCI